MAWGWRPWRGIPTMPTTASSSLMLERPLGNRTLTSRDLWVGTNPPGGSQSLTRMLIAVVAMFLQQTCGSVGRVLPAVLAPLIIVELHADPSWVGVYFGLAAMAA